MFGSAVTQWVSNEGAGEADWLIGDEIMGPTCSAKRCGRCGTRSAYDNPILGKDPQPAHYDDHFAGPATTRASTSTRASRTAPFTWRRRARGALAAARIWYHALHFLKPNSTFAQAATQVADSARILVKAGAVHKGAAQIVRGAWRAVGVV